MNKDDVLKLADMLTHAAENLRLADRDERQVGAAFSLAHKLEAAASRLHRHAHADGTTEHVSMFKEPAAQPAQPAQDEPIPTWEQHMSNGEWNQVRAMHKEIADLRAALTQTASERDREDAERYLWLKTNAAKWSWNPYGHAYKGKVVGFAANGMGYLDHSFESAVIAARQQEKQS